ncbi:DEAD/DEAH box helicase [Paenibacillus sp. EPM92]|uniref:DEAD/DEAH box helicase n=1 Tax=Paenibacillus sp. EPM92 TaxID=1561195 RepID=UPI001915A30A|nr:DEAD/DEAH box helicase [Paenibacillus sp. EPM92]
MLDLDAVMVEGEQLESGEWLLWEESELSLSGSQLRMRLFAWHPRSLYGTLLREGTGFRGESLVLSPYDALDYFAAPGNSLHLPVEWSDKLKLAQQAASLLREALVHGWYAPEASAWQEGKREWKPLLPDKQQELYAKLHEELLAEGIDASRWFTQAVEELLVSEPAVREAWDKLCEEQPLLTAAPFAEEKVPSALALDEEEWLTAVSWKKDEIPFRICLQLVEPNMDSEGDDAGNSEDSFWTLRMLLQDKHDPNMMVEGELDGNTVRALAEGFAGRIPFAWEKHVERKLGALFERAESLVPELFEQRSPGEDRLPGRLTDEAAWRFLNEDSLKLLQAGFSVFLPVWWEELRRSQPRLKAQLKSSVGSRSESFFGADQLMKFDWKVAVGELDFSEEEFARLTAEKKRLLYIRGRWIQLDPAFVAAVRQAMKRVGKQGLSFREVLELHLLGAGRGDNGTVDAEQQEAETTELRIEVELNSHMAELIGRLQHMSRIPIVEPPVTLQAGLRNYQKAGVSWLLFLRQFGLGACLADDMGLGKTIQFIAYLLHARNGTVSLAGARSHDRAAAKQAPALLICPTSVLGNWQKELERFAPTLRVYLHYGPQRAKGEAFIEAVSGFDLVLTSYNLAQLDEAECSSVVWDVIGLDEAQNIKNVHTKQSAAIRRFDALHRIALTGTPIENRLTELWSIFDFINPGYLGSLSAFTHKYVNPIEKGGDPELVEQVQKLIRPFLLRRVKKDPAIQLDLPDKTETKAYVSLTLEQASLYENVVQDLMNRIDSLTGMEKKGLILATLTKLKQICNHPALFLKEPEPGPATWEDRSGKVERLLELVHELRDEGDSCLIFTQFVGMGHMLKAILERELGGTVYFLHGGVPKKQRDAMIARFQGEAAASAGKPIGAGVEAAEAGKRPGAGAETGGGIFILSLKAGGTGLNLTAANHVFHFDRWWNPAVENQATDRAFRIGQTQNVQVHKFVTLGTLEERIDEMIERKLGLSQQIVGAGENWVTEMTTDELRDMFALRREWIGK